MSEIISVKPPAGTQKRIGVPAEQPAGAIDALKVLFAGIPNVISARLGLMELVYPDGRSVFSYTIGIECRASRDWIEHKTLEVLKSAPSGRWPISLVPPTATYFTEGAIVFYRAPATNPAAIAQGASSALAHVEPAIDVNRAVENPGLVRAIDRLAREKSDAAEDNLLSELQRATYLAVMLGDDVKRTPGQYILPKGSKFHVLALPKEASEGKFILPLFSDWSAIKAFTDRNVTGCILPAREAWAFALESGAYDGVVINPAHNALPIEPDMVRHLLEKSRKT